MSLEVDGMNELLRTLRDLKGRIDKRTEEKALKAGAKILSDEIKREALKIRDDYTLYENIQETTVKNGKIIVHTGEAYHAHLIEFGRSSGSGYYKKNGKLQRITWGDTAPNPVMQGSFERKKKEILSKMAEIVKGDLGL